MFYKSGAIPFSFIYIFSMTDCYFKKVKCENTIVPAEYAELPLFYHSDGSASFTEDYKFSVFIKADGVRYVLEVCVRKGFRYDGCSAPKIVNKWLPKYKKNAKYDICALVHDILYGTRGEVLKLPKALTADSCDAIYRGSLREAGLSRLIASSADFWLVFAHNKKHFGADQYNPNKYASIEARRL